MTIEGQLLKEAAETIKKIGNQWRSAERCKTSRDGDHWWALIGIGSGKTASGFRMNHECTSCGVRRSIVFEKPKKAS